MQPEPYGNEPTVAPEVKAEGRAWFIANDPEHPHRLAAWLVNAVDRWYVLGLVRLGGVGDWYLHDSSMTHQLMLVELDPSNPLPSLPGCKVGAEGMMVWERQYSARSDEAARGVAGLILLHLCQQTRSAAIDMREYWCSTIDMTAEHAMFGCHPTWN